MYFIAKMTSDNLPVRYLLPRVISPEESPDFDHLDQFNCHRPAHLFPSPAEVRANPPLRAISGSSTTRFDSLNIVVKYGEDITASEAHCLRALRRLLPDEVPVPEVYGWCEDKGQVFIYMEHIKGVTLESQWELLSDQAKKEVCKQLRSVMKGLHKLQQDPSDQFLGEPRMYRKREAYTNLLQVELTENLLDIVFTDSMKPPGGPFDTVKDFHDWLSSLIKMGKEIHFADPSQIPDPFREYLPDDSRIFFTHGDLHPSNILMSDDASGRVLAIIDWHQSGWYPDYWEYCKALFTSDFVGDWATEYIPQFLDAIEFYDAWAWYPRALGY